MTQPEETYRELAPGPSARTWWRIFWWAFGIGMAAPIGTVIAIVSSFEDGLSPGFLALVLVVVALSLVRTFAQRRWLRAVKRERSQGYTTIPPGRPGDDLVDPRTGRVLRAAARDLLPQDLPSGGVSEYAGAMTDWWYNHKTGEVEEGAQSLGSDRDGPYATREDAARAPEIAAERARKWAAEESSDN